jgi:hypothetical protein
MNRNSNFHFWQKWLFYSSLLFALVGILMASTCDSILFKPYNDLLAHVFWRLDMFPENIEPFRNFIFACFGGTMACTYVLVAFIAHYSFRKKEKWSRLAISCSFLIWVSIDSIACLRYGMNFQIYAINLFSILIKALPLYFTRREFRMSGNSTRLVY